MSATGQHSVLQAVIPVDATEKTEAASVIKTGKCRKRKKFDQGYQQNIAKKQKLLHVQHLNRAGKQKDAVESNFEVGPKCPQLCRDVTIETKTQTLQNFLLCATKDEQDLMLFTGINVKAVKNRRPQNLGNNRKLPVRNRAASFCYKWSGKDCTNQVCKKCFTNIYGITESPIKQICVLRLAGNSPHDKRGKHVPCNAMSDSLFQKVKDHIASYPVQISHYKNGDAYYINPLLSVKAMRRMYCEKYPLDQVSYQSYRNIFNSQFNLRFKPPQVDVCCTCENLSVKIQDKQLNDNARRVFVAEKIVHLRRANKFYKKLQDVRELCKNNPEEFGFTFDYMQNLSLPTIPIQSTFYWRQLTVNVFSVCNVKTNAAKYYISDERAAGKGPEETASYLYDYIRNEIPKEVKQIHVFADNCPSQNKNNVLIGFMSFLAQEHFESVFLYFPMRGHSFLPNDRTFATVKCSIRKHDRHYTTQEVRDLVLESSQIPSQYTATLIQRRDILNFKSWWSMYYRKTMFSEETKRKPRTERVAFLISKFFHYKIERPDTGRIVARPFIDGLVQHSFIIRRKTLSFRIPANFTPLRGQRKLKQKILDDLHKFQPYLPDKKKIQAFWENVLKIIMRNKFLLFCSSDAILCNFFNNKTRNLNQNNLSQFFSTLQHPKGKRDFMCDYIICSSDIYFNF